MNRHAEYASVLVFALLVALNQHLAHGHFRIKVRKCLKERIACRSDFHERSTGTQNGHCAHIRGVLDALEDAARRLHVDILTRHFTHAFLHQNPKESLKRDRRTCALYWRAHGTCWWVCSCLSSQTSEHGDSTVLPQSRRYLVLQDNKIRELAFHSNQKNGTNTAELQERDNNPYFPQQPLLSFLAAEGTTVGLAPLFPGWTEAFLRVKREADRPLLHNLSGHRHEGSLDVGRVLGRSLHKLNAETVRELLRRLIGNHLLGGQIRLVADQELYHVLVGITINFVQPGLHIVEGVLICHIVHNDNAVRTSVVRGGDRTETLLTCGIPLRISLFASSDDLKLHRLAVKVNRADLLSPHSSRRSTYEIHTNGSNVAIRVLIVRKSQQQAGLTDTRITDKQKLEQIVTTRR